MLRTFYFVDELEQLVGQKSLELVADTPYLLLSALTNQIPSIAERMNSLRIGFVVKNDQGEYEGIDLLDSSRTFGDETEIYCVSSVEGSGIETVAVALAAAIGVSVVTATVIIMVAAAVVVGVVVASLSPTPSSTESTAAEKAEAFVWQGIENNVNQGAPVPLVFGTFLVGSTVVSADVVVDEERLEQPTPPPSPDPVEYQPYASYQSEGAA